MILLGIAGKAGSGKDTVGEILARSYGFNTLSFALPIQEMVTGLLGFPSTKWADREWRETPLPAFNGFTPRYLAQTLGTEWGRRLISDTLWFDLAFENLTFEDDTRLAVTDVRFRNEADMIRSPEVGGYIIHVYRTEQAASGSTLASHSSELGIGAPNTEDFHLNNFGTIDELAVQVGQVVDRILELQQIALEQEEEAVPDEEV